MSLLDLLIAILVGTSAVAGFIAGFARVGIGLLATIFGLLFGFWFYGYPAALMHTFTKSNTLANLIGFFLVFWIFMLAGALLAKLVARLFKWTGLSWLDRLLGGAFGLARGGLISVVFVTVLMAFIAKPLPNWMIDSKLLPYAVDASDMLSAMAPFSIKDAFRDSLAEIRRSWDEQLKRAKEKLDLRKRKSAQEKEQKADRAKVDSAESNRKARPPAGPSPQRSQPAGKQRKENSNVGRPFDF